MVFIGATSPFPPGTGPIYYDNTDCTGRENRLLACQYDTHVADCMHSNDVGVDCGGVGRSTWNANN